MNPGTHIDYKFCPMCASPLVEGEIDHAVRRYCPECKWIHYLNPAVVVCVIAHCSGKVVLVERGVEPAKGEWSLPGGFLDVLEEPVDGAKRELYEETSLKVNVSNLELIDAVHQPSSRYTSVIVIGYSVEIGEMLPLKGGDDVVDAKWVNVADVEKLPFESFNRLFDKWKNARA